MSGHRVVGADLQTQTSLELRHVSVPAVSADLRAFAVSRRLLRRGMGMRLTRAPRPAETARASAELCVDVVTATNGHPRLDRLTKRQPGSIAFVVAVRTGLACQNGEDEQDDTPDERHETDPEPAAAAARVMQSPNEDSEARKQQSQQHDDGENGSFYGKVENPRNDVAEDLEKHEVPVFGPSGPSAPRRIFRMTSPSNGGTVRDSGCR